jgi:hypothetical protein
MYANKLSQIILIIVLIISFLSYGSGKGIYATNSNQSKTGDGLPAKPSSPSVQKATVTSQPSKQTTKEMIECDSECKTKQLITLGVRKEIASSLVINCKALTDDPVHCIKF